MTSSDQNPYEPPENATSTVGLPAPSALKLMLYTLAVTSGIGLLVIERLFVLAIILLVFSDDILMTSDERKRSPEPLSGAQIKRNAPPVLAICGFVFFFGESPEVRMGIKALMVVAALWLVCHHWWRWGVCATVASAPSVTDSHND